MATSINDHQLDDHLFEKVENQTNGRLFRPWDCAMNETAKATIKAHLKENNIDLNGLSDSLKELKELSCLNALKDLDALKDLKRLNTVENSKSSLSLPKLPNDYLTEMFSANCTMNQSSLNAMETMEIYSHFYRDYLASSSKTLALKMKNGNSLNDSLSFLNSFSDKTTNKIDGRSANGLASNSLLTNGLITDNRIANGLTPLSSNHRTSKLSCSASANQPPTLSHQLPVNSATKSTEATNRFLTPLQIDKNQTKKPRPKRFRCPHCDIAFSNNGQLKGHIRTHTGKLLFFELFLFRVYSSAKNLKDNFFWPEAENTRMFCELCWPSAYDV